MAWPQVVEHRLEPTRQDPPGRPLRILLAVPHSDAVDQGAKIADE